MVLPLAAMMFEDLMSLLFSDSSLAPTDPFEIVPSDI